LKTQVLIIGGGATGTGLARDLALRGIHCVLAEKQDINAGASGGNQGLLHSGARYIASDPSAAVECRREGRLLKKLAAHCIEDTGGLFVAVAGDDENYIADFPQMCAQYGIPAHFLDVKDAREMEPALSDQIIAAFHVEDATIDPFRLSLGNIAHAQQLGTCLLRFTQAVDFKIINGKIRSVLLRNRMTGKKMSIEPEIVVNASGAWASRVAAMAGVHIGMLYSKGSMTETYLCPEGPSPFLAPLPSVPNHLTCTTLKFMKSTILLKKVPPCCPSWHQPIISAPFVGFVL